ncbi:MAG: hypothetical protein AB7L13_00150 [Acidimicrobiia bacterium]
MARIRYGARRQGYVAAVLGAALVATACGQPAYKYESNASEKTFFKIPSSFAHETLTIKETEGRPKSLPSSIETLWHVTFSGDKAARSDNPDVLAGDAVVYSLDFSARESITLSYLRAQQFGGQDPLNPDTDLEGKLELVGVEQRSTGANGAGTRVIANVKVDENPDVWVTVDSITAIDFLNQKAYVLTMQCESHCYEQNRKTADSIAASWKVNT